MELKPVLKGLASYVPGLYAWRSRRGHLRTANAEYCYSVWLRHLKLLDESDGFTIPKTVAELGPGAALGVGLAALLSGADTYYALDIVEYSRIESNLELLDDMVAFFRRRTPVSTGYAGDSPEPTFPRHILTDELLAETLSEPRLADIRRAIAAPDGRSGPITIKYTVPWSDPAVIRRHEVDLIVSYSVLEHVDDVPGTYDAFAQWLRPGGRMSHSVDFRSHFDTKAWNSHWQYSEPVWKLVVGKKPFLINRQPYSVHIAEMKKRGFEITREAQKREQGLPREDLAPRWRSVSEDDYTCAEAMIQARLPEK